MARFLGGRSDILNHEGVPHKKIPTGDVVSEKNRVLERWDITDENLKSIDRQKVGMLLGRLGFARAPGHGSVRSWLVTLREIEEHAKLAGIALETVDRREENIEAFGYFDQIPTVNNADECPF